MSDVVDHDPDVHGVVVPARMYTASAAGRAVRAIALLVLVFAALTVVTSFAPAQRSAQDLSADLTAGRAAYVEYEPGTRTVRWVVDLVLWRETRLPARADVPADGNPRAQDLTWLEQQITASGHPVGLAEANGTSGGLWLRLVRWPPLQFATVAIWLLALVHMLVTGGHRLANRWAWFWMFTFGQLGALVYLLCEPVPLWRSQLLVTGRRPIGGGMGLVYSVLLAFAGGLVGMVAAFVLR
jgi:hypothetical protein